MNTRVFSVIYHYLCIMSEFRENLRDELDFQDIKVKELSEKSGIPKATLECYLRTQSVEPSAENAVKIAKALHVSVEHLVSGEKTSRAKQHMYLCQEARKLIRLIESLNTDQCKAVLRLINTFQY